MSARRILRHDPQIWPGEPSLHRTTFSNTPHTARTASPSPIDRVEKSSVSLEKLLRSVRYRDRCEELTGKSLKTGPVSQQGQMGITEMFEAGTLPPSIRAIWDTS
jgi:hypothetical protein